MVEECSTAGRRASHGPEQHQGNTLLCLSHFRPVGRACKAHTTRIMESRQNKVEAKKLAHTLKEAALLVGVSTTSLRRAIYRDQLRACRKFRHILITRQELERFLGIEEGK